MVRPPADDRNLSKTDVGLFRQSFGACSRCCRSSRCSPGSARRSPATWRCSGRLRPGRGRRHGPLGHGDASSAPPSPSASASTRLSGWIANAIYDNPDLQFPLRTVPPCHPPRITSDHVHHLLGLPHAWAQRALGLMLIPRRRGRADRDRHRHRCRSDRRAAGVRRACRTSPPCSPCVVGGAVRVCSVTPRFVAGDRALSSVAWLATFTTQGLLWVDQLISCRCTSARPSSPSTAWPPASSCSPRSP